MPELAAALAEVWQRRRGEALRVNELRPLSAGASASSYLLRADSDGRPVDAVLQLANGGQTFGFALERAAQAAVQQRAAQAGVPTPEILLSVGPDDGLAPGFVSRFQAGESLGRRIVSDPDLAAAREHLLPDCAAALAAIHALNPVDFPELPQRGAALQLAELATLHRSFDEALPAFEAAFAWLEDRTPADDERTVVHGDFRTGNLLVTPEGLGGVLDWELAHLGDPLQDLGWLCLRSWRFGADQLPVGGFAARKPFYAAYEQAAGRRVDPQRLRFWELFGCVKWGVICQWFAHQRLAGEIHGLEPALTGRRVSEVEIQIVDLLAGQAH